ncbi:MAG: AAA family ATPase [Pseudomonadota bacterium]
MISVVGYTNLQLIYQGPETLVYRATRRIDKRPVVLRQLRADRFSPSLAAQYQREYALLRTIESARVIAALDLVEADGTVTLVTEDVGGTSLAELPHLPLNDVIALAIAIVDGLDDLHAQYIVHKDICPGNLILNPATGQLKIIDLGIASQTRASSRRPEPGLGPEGTLPYMAPEQTGRLNRSVDYRADFYALGATLYELLTGNPPFRADSVLEMIYSHVALMPTAPAEVSPAVPASLSNIVMKLLAKMPEERYQSTFALRADLNRCLELVSGGTDAGFQIALDDIPEQMLLTQKLLEREAQLQQIKDGLAAAAAGTTEIVVCHGKAGTGKSALIREFQKEVLTGGGLFVSARHNPASPERPYGAVSVACRDLVRQLQARVDNESIRVRLAQALGENVGVITQLVPELAPLFPDRGQDLNLPPIEARSRLLWSLTTLIQTLSSEEHPFVLVIESLHWIDKASLELFEPLIIAQRIPGLMVLCAYRPEELNLNSDTRQVIERIMTSGAPIRLVRLTNLSAQAIAVLLSESFFRPVEDTLTLARLIHDKTGGNPLAVHAFISNLGEVGALRFDRRHREWTWDLTTASATPPTENVGEQLSASIGKLEPATAQLLKIASCAGEDFDLEMLREVSGLSFPETAARLLNAVREGFIIYRPVDATHPGRQAGPLSYRFAHERIQQAAYALLDNEEKRQIHGKIGEVLLRAAEADETSRIFDVVNHLNNGITRPDRKASEDTRLASLNIAAGNKAKAAGAFQAAFKYYRTAIALQGPRLWDRYDESLELHLDTAEAAYLCGDQNQVELTINSVLTHARSPLDRARALEIRLRALIAFEDIESALSLGDEVLELLNVRVPRMGGPGFIRMLGSLIYQVIRVSQSSTLPTRKMTDPGLLAAMRILMVMCQASYLNGSPQTGMYILRMTQLSVRHGLAPESSFAYPMFGALIITYLGTISAGYRFGMLAMQNLDEHNKELHCKSLTLVNNFISIWKQPVRNTLEPLSRAYQTGMETGDVEFALIAAIMGTVNAFLLGHDLNSLDASLARYNRQAADLNQTPILGIGSIYQQAIRNLSQPAGQPWLLVGDIYVEEDLIPFHEANGDESSLANLYIVKLFLAVLFRRDREAMDYARLARPKLSSVVSSPALAFFMLYESLAMLSSLKSVTPITALRLNLRISYNQRLFRKWAHHAPANILHGYHLVEAERHRIAGRNTAALEAFDLAISAASENGYLKEQALANELAGRFHLGSGKRELALFYLRRARAAYTRWGAISKVRALDTEFVELSEDDLYTGRGRLLSAAGTSIKIQGQRDMRGYGEFLDLGSVIKASQVLAGEIVLDNLLERLMQVALENAGAQKAALVLSRDNRLNLEMTTDYQDQKPIHVRQEIPIEQASDIPVSVVQYVARTREDLVLNDAMNEDIFTQDAYIVSRKPKSILCIPILSKSHLTGVLYLENMQTTLAFTKDRVAILRLLASQSAIAIENARLYQQLNDSRNKYLSLYQNAVEGIFELDGRGMVTNINPAAAHLMGYDSAEQALRHGSFDPTKRVVNPEDAEHVRALLNQEQRVIGYELLIRRNDESTIWVALSAQVFTGDNDDDFRVEGSIIDITERKLREEAEQATRLARAATETKSQFLANMSHEIRTPMNAIVGYTNLALKTPLSEQQASYLETIRNSSNHLLRVVNDILDLSRVESGKLELQHTPFRLRDIVTDLHNLFDLEAQQKGIRLLVPDIADAEEDFFVGDPVRIGQILINLVGNALKFTDTGEVRVEFETVHLKDERACLNFTVADTGIGIDASQLNTIFDSFVQGNAPSREEGTGLGLAICKSLVEMMEGHIHAVSTPGEGSQFYFSVIVGVDRDQRVKSAAPAATAGSLEGQTLLLVEDNAINRNLALEVLSQAGLSVVVAENGAEALAALETQAFFAVLMDLRMPVMNGIEAIRQIRAIPAFATLPTIALSASVLKSEVDEAISAGFDHYLSKPVDFAELLDLLRAIGNVAPAPPVEPMPAAQIVIRGVDFGRALRNHGGDRELLSSLMTEFVKIYRFSDEDLRALLASADPVRAERLAHNVAGVAGSFGAMALMNAARALEHEIRDGALHLDDQLEAFGRELINFLRAIEQFQLAEPTSVADA